MKRLTIGLVVVLVLGASDRSNGAVIFEEDFESYSPPFIFSSSAQTPPGDWVQIGSQGTAASATVVADPLSVFGQSLFFDDNDFGDDVNIHHSFDAITNIRFSFYMQTRDADDEGTFVSLRGDAGQDSLLVFGNEAGGLGLRNKIAILRDTGWETVVLDSKENTWYHVVRLLDTSIDSTLASSGMFYVAEVDEFGNDILTSKGVTGTWNEINIGSFAANTFIDTIALATSGSQGSNSYIDNLLVEAIPEPSSIAVFSRYDESANCLKHSVSNDPRWLVISAGFLMR